MTLGKNASINLWVLNENDIENNKQCYVVVSSPKINRNLKNPKKFTKKLLFAIK